MSSRFLLARVALGAVACFCSLPATAQIVISGNENKIDLTTGTQKVIPNVPPDSLSILDFAQFPPKVTTIADVPNSVVGPPSNIAIHPSGNMALIANSLKIDPSAATGWSPEKTVHILDLTSNPPKVIGKVESGLQPSGISFTPDGKRALVADRAAGTITVLGVDGMKVSVAQSVKVAEPAESLSDVAISPDGKLALASAQKGGYLALLKIDDAGSVSFTGRKISTYGQPYRVAITPDGELAVTAGGGAGNGLDQDALTVIDLKAAPGPRATDYAPVGTVPESLELSPDGKLCAVVVMEGSNMAADNPIHSNAGALVILERKGRTFEVTQKLPVGRIPEGVAFTSDGKYLVVQCHPDRKLWIFRVNGSRVEDTGTRIDVPGMPSSLRASVKH